MPLRLPAAVGRGVRFARPQLSPVAWLALGTGAFLLVHFFLRLACGLGPHTDDIEQFLFTQRFAWGYSEQPPLYTWLCQVAFAVTGPTVAGLTVVRVGLVAAGCVFAYLLARRLTPDPRLAAVAAAAPVLVPELAWPALTVLTHSNLAAVTVLALAWAVLRVAERPTTGNYLVLGLVCGLGALAKYNFSWCVAAFVVVAITLPEFRRLVFSPRMLLAAAVAVLVLLPHALWLLAHWSEVMTALRAKAVRTGNGAGPLWGLWEYVASTVECFLPVVAVVFVSFRRSNSDSARPAADVLLGRFFAVTAVVLGVALVAGGANHFMPRWLHLYAPLFAVWWVARVPVPVAASGIRRLVAAVVVFAAGLTAARGYETTGAFVIPGRWFSAFTDFGPVADAIRSEVSERPVIVTSEPMIAAGLRSQLPGATAIWVGSPMFNPSPAGGPVVVVWFGADLTHPPAELLRAAESLGLSGVPGDVRTADTRVGPTGLPAPTLAFARLRTP